MKQLRLTTQEQLAHKLVQVLYLGHQTPISVIQEQPQLTISIHLVSTILMEVYLLKYLKIHLQTLALQAMALLMALPMKQV
jgi:hypothetical protein